MAILVQLTNGSSRPVGVHDDPPVSVPNEYLFDPVVGEVVHGWERPDRDIPLVQGQFRTGFGIENPNRSAVQYPDHFGASVTVDVTEDGRWNDRIVARRNRRRLPGIGVGSHYPLGWLSFPVWGSQVLLIVGHVIAAVAAHRVAVQRCQSLSDARRGTSRSSF